MKIQEFYKQYELRDELGSGARSKVRLGVDYEAKKVYAIKIIKKENVIADSHSLDLLIAEVEALKAMKEHPNILKFIDYDEFGVIKRPGDTFRSNYDAFVIVLEFAQKGELYDLIAVKNEGPFPEPLARYFFKQLIDGLDHMHKAGLAHRDLKPENILLDEDYRLKIADFGFSTKLEGKDGSGFLKTRLGTESYIAPEIKQRKEYRGEPADLFSASIILFIMMTQHPPFHSAVPSDPYYRLICNNHPETFWRSHDRKKPAGFFSEDFKDLMTKLFDAIPTNRPTIEQIR